MRKKVYFVISASNFGGHENMFLNILNILNYDFDVSIFVNADNEILISKLECIENIQYIPFQCRMNGSFHFNLLNLFSDFVSHALFLNQNITKNSTIIFFDGGLFASISLQFSTFFKSATKILCIPVLPNLKLYNNNFKFYLLCRYLKSFHKIITVNKNYVHFFKERFKLNNIEHIPNFIPDQKFNFRPSLATTNNEKINLLYLGRISFADKALDKFVKKISIYQPENFIFTIIGDGPDKSALVELINFYNLSNRFLLKGWKSLSEINFSEFDLMFQCSNFEGDSLAILESINNGLNVVSTDVGTFREYFPLDQIFYIDSPKSFTNAVFIALENSKSNQFWDELGFLQYSTRNLNAIKLRWSDVCAISHI